MTRKRAIKEALGGKMSEYAPKSIGFPGAVKRKGLSASKARISSAIQPGLGGQLSRRVASGAISESQAQRTATQRDLLKEAFGSDWRTQVFGKGGATGVAGPFALGQIRAKRSKALRLARTKVQGSGGTSAP